MRATMRCLGALLLVTATTAIQAEEAGFAGNLCKVSTWGTWSDCSTSCGRGMMSRLRTIEQKGADCPPQAESKECLEENCPVNCIMSAPMDLNPVCSKSCGKGFKIIRRSIMREPMYGGLACPDHESFEYCNTESCPIDCEMNTWSSWGTCSKSCGVGTQKAIRQKSNGGAEFGGKGCGASEKVQECNHNACVKACEVSKWVLEEKCTRSCGTGYQKHVRKVTSGAVSGGAACPVLLKFSECNTHKCPIDCKVSEYTGFGPCTKTCGGGYKTRHRSALITDAYGGVECPALEETEECATSHCPQDCSMTTFGGWTTCSESCGGGSTTRSRSVSNGGQAAYNGKPCPHHHEAKACNKHLCPINCEMSNFTKWQDCDVSCGGGTQWKAKTILQPTMYGGVACPPVHEHKELRACNLQNCATNCKLSNFTKWSVCTRSCSSGSQTRSRKVLAQPRDGGEECPATDENDVEEVSRNCNAHCCDGEGLDSTKDHNDWHHTGDVCKICPAGTRSHENVCKPCPYGSYSAAGSAVCPPKGPVGSVKFRLTFSSTTASLKTSLKKVVASTFGIPQSDVAVVDGEVWEKTDTRHLSHAHGWFENESGQHLDVTMQVPDMTELTKALDLLHKAEAFLTSLETGLADEGFKMNCKAVVAGKHFVCLLTLSNINTTVTAPGHTKPPTLTPTPFPTPAPTCGPGYFSDSEDGDTGCTACAAGRYLKETELHRNEHVCAKCPAGYGTGSEGSVSCPLCANGKFSAGDSECLNCPDGSFSAKRPEGKNKKCFKCDKGRFSSTKAGISSFVTCSDCKKGKFAGVKGSASCKDCPGHYFSRSQQGGCSQCPHGKFHAETFSTFLYELGWHGEKCVDYKECGLGKELAGHTTDSNGKCVDCEDKEYQPKANKWDAPCLTCGSCAKGSERSDCEKGEKGTCELCEIGMFKNDGTNKVCEMCDFGQFAPKLGAKLCKTCPAGYIAGKGAGKCTPCNKGTSTWNPAAKKTELHKCTTCLAGLFTDKTPSSKCESCPGGYYNDGGDSSCSACLPGTRGEGQTQDSSYCKGCASGRFQAASGKTECKQCPKGRHSMPVKPFKVKNDCVDCNPGLFQDKLERDTCKDCTEGTFSKKFALPKVCGDCPACPHPHDFRKGCGGKIYGTCTTCPNGKFNQIWKCGDHEACPKGKFGAKHGKVCEKCPSGKYKEAFSTVECSNCKSCPAGHMRIGCTSESAGECVACGKGTYKERKFDWDTGCLICDKGRYTGNQAADVGSHKCKFCPVGKYQLGEASAIEAEECEKCKPGRFGYKKTVSGKPLTMCAPCIQGQWQKNWGKPSCANCASGRYNEIPESSKNCKQCPFGKFHITTDLYCTNCIAGKYIDTKGHHSPPLAIEDKFKPCSVCPGGKFSGKTAGRCKHCFAGMYETGTQTSCKHCPKGQFQESDLQQKCVDCESGFHMAFKGSKICKKCREPLAIEKPMWPVHRNWWTKNLAGSLKCEKKPLDCLPGSWSAWGTCSRSCGKGGTQTRTRKQVHEGWGGGTMCSQLEDTGVWNFKLKTFTETSECNTYDCPVNCEVSTWESWDMCTAPCGTGDQTRERGVTVDPRHGGNACPHLKEDQKCNRQKCICKAMSCEYMEHTRGPQGQPAAPGQYTIHVTHGLGKTSDFGKIPDTEGKHHGLAADYFTNDGIHHCKYDRATEKCECTCPGLRSESYTHHRDNTPRHGHVFDAKHGTIHQGRAVFSPTNHNHTAWAMHQNVWPEWHDIKHDTGLHGSTDTYTWRATHVPGSVAYRDRLASESSE